MAEEKLAYTNFMWSLGTTSFRTVDFNKRIEQQLLLLDEFWNKPAFKELKWTQAQPHYYDFMKSNDFVKGDAKRKDKDAREKTSGLVSMGLVTDDRKITEAGKALLNIFKEEDYSPDNLLNIPKDSFIYMKQLLKTSINVTSVDGYVRPYIVVMYLISKLNYLTIDEFKHLTPLCTSYESTEYIIDQIKLLRVRQTNINDIIYSFISEMDNYKKALNLFIQKTVDEDLICQIGMNRKSSGNGTKKYDKSYYPVYEILKKICLYGDLSQAENLYSEIGNIKIGLHWKLYLFKSALYEKKDYSKLLKRDLPIFNVKNEKEFKIEFFKLMHIFKTKATLWDYFDLNRRYLKITDTLLFEDNIVKFDVIPKTIFTKIIDELYVSAYTKSDLLELNCSLEQISPSLELNERSILENINNEFNCSLTNVDQAKEMVENQKLERFNHLIETKFSDKKLLQLLTAFEKRKDSEIQRLVTNNADIPTIFEYVIGIIWYKISNRKGNILKYMNLSLEADLLPKSHAGGGLADIEYLYDSCADYPEHCLMLEVTLMNESAQKHNEDEPVTRHLGEYRLRNKDKHAYCVFSSTEVPMNLISSFRNKKTYEYFNRDHTEAVSNFKIIPLKTNELKTIIKKEIKYPQLYRTFEQAYQSTVPTTTWYSKCIEEKIV